jgi:predicted MPP superfamily phosphohydrolase
MNVAYNKSCILSSGLAAFIQTLGLEEYAINSVLEYQLHENILTVADKCMIPEFTILHLSDLHADYMVDDGDKLIQMLATIRCDLCVLTGDYGKGSKCSFQKAAALLRRIYNTVESKYGFYAVQGNHDSVALMRDISRIGISVLDNRNVCVATQNGVLNIIGVSDPHYFRAHDFRKATAHLDQRFTNLLLVHSPEVIQEASDYRMDLYLCGHSHGGQVCLWEGMPIINNSDCHRDYIDGGWRYGDMQGYTSRGIGVTGFPLRHKCPPEIVIHKIRSE